MKGFLTGLILTFSLSVFADTWSDPSWIEMLEKSHVITIAKIIKGGKFGAKYKVLETLKGDLGNKEIWVTGFSNKYGPINRMRIGDKYLLFLFKSDTSKFNSSYRSSSNFANKKRTKQSYKSFSFVMSQSNGYYTWTPTAGTYKIDKNKIQYNLLETTEFSKSNYNSVSEFRDFLNAFFDSSKRERFHTQIIDELKKIYQLDSKKSSKYLMMLYLTGNKNLSNPITSIISSKHELNRYALSKQLGNIETDEARKLLEQLISDSSELVRGEAVRQISKYKSEFIGPLLINALHTSSVDTNHPNIMNPILNNLDDGQIQIIRTLGEINYIPAIDKLLPLLRTNDSYVFDVVSASLVELGVSKKKLIPEIKWHFQNDTAHQIYRVTSLITRYEVIEAKNILMEYIRSHDKSIHPNKSYMISVCCGLAHFDDLETREFLIEEFENVLKMPKNSSTIDNKEYWVREFIEVFNKLKVKGMSNGILSYLTSDYNLSVRKVSSIVMRLYFDYLAISSNEEDLGFLRELKKLKLPENEYVNLDKLIASILQPIQDK